MTERGAGMANDQAQTVDEVGSTELDEEMPEYRQGWAVSDGDLQRFIPFNLDDVEWKRVSVEHGFRDVPESLKDFDFPAYWE